MCKPGSYLGVEAMAHYCHVDGKDQLFAGVVDKIIDDFLEDPRLTSEAASWEDYLLTVEDTMSSDQSF